MIAFIPRTGLQQLRIEFAAELVAASDSDLAETIIALESLLAVAQAEQEHRTFERLSQSKSIRDD